ncbi:hypothetical protein HKD37_U058080 [Glycine soja]
MEADMEAMKEQMAAMMEAMMSVKKIMEANAVAIAATSVVAKVNPTSPSSLNQMNHPTLDMVGKDLGSRDGLHDPNKHAFPPQGLPPNYTPPNVAYTLNEDVNNSIPIPIESRQPQTVHAHVSQPMGEIHEIPHHNLADFEPWLGYATEGQAVGARKPVEFTPIPVSYADLLPYLLDNSMVAITPTKVHEPPFLREYDSNATCACHGEAPGHSIEHCRALKRKVQGLIDAGWLKFEENRV